MRERRRDSNPRYSVKSLQRASDRLHQPFYTVFELTGDLYLRLAVDRDVKRERHPGGGAGVHPYFGTVEFEDEVRVAVGDWRRLG